MSKTWRISCSKQEGKTEQGKGKMGEEAQRMTKRDGVEREI